MNTRERLAIASEIHSLAEDELGKATPRSMQRAVRIINLLQELILISNEIEEEGDDE